MLGDLADVPLADVLRLMSSGRKTGLLTASDEGQQALVRFERGVLVHAASGLLQGDDAVLDLFGWKKGQLTFVPGQEAAPPNVTRPVDALIEDGLRLGDSLHRRAALLPNDRVAFQPTDGPQDPEARVTLGATEWKVLLLLDGVRNVAEVTEASRLPRVEVTRVLLDLTEAGFLEKVEPQKPLRAQGLGLFGRDTAEVDEKLAAEWTRLRRCAAGVARVEIRTLKGRVAHAAVSFREGLHRDIHLPRPVLAALNAREGEDVWVRPA